MTAETTESPTIDAADPNESSRDDVATDTDAPKGNREARYRTERNDAREALATAQARIDAMQVREVERLAGALLSAPGDLLTLSGKALADFLDGNGDIDPELVSEAAADVLTSRPGLRPNAPAYDRSQGHGSNPGTSGPTRGPLQGLTTKDLPTPSRLWRTGKARKRL